MKLQKDTKLWWFCAPKASGNCGCSNKFSIRQSQKWIDHLQKKDEKIVYLFFERKNCVNFNKKVESRSTQWGKEDFSSLIEKEIVSSERQSIIKKSSCTDCSYYVLSWYELKQEKQVQPKVMYTKCYKPLGLYSGIWYKF